MWSRTNGTLVLTVATGGLSASTSCTISFSLRNNVTDHGAAELSVSAAVDSGGGFDSPIVEVVVASDTGDLDGVVGGKAPLRAVKPLTLNT